MLLDLKNCEIYINRYVVEDRNCHGNDGLFLRYKFHCFTTDLEKFAGEDLNVY